MGRSPPAYRMVGGWAPGNRLFPTILPIMKLFPYYSMAPKQIIALPQI